MTDNYNFRFDANTVYSTLIDLISRLRRFEDAVVVDIGCGHGAIAEPLRDLGATYIGFDVDPTSLGDLESRGFETEAIDLNDVPASIDSIAKRVAGRPLGAIVLLDTLEHLRNGPEVLIGLREFSLSHGSAPLFLGVPNVTHIDLASKLLIGRWDVTPTGLLDETHVSFFSPWRLREMTAATGWLEIASEPYTLPDSDQHFPAACATLNRHTTLHKLLLNVRSQSEEGALVNEFLSAYLPTSSGVPVIPRRAESRYFLSVLMRTQGLRPSTLEDAILSLAAQTSQNFELLVLAHNVPREQLGTFRYLADTFAGDFGSRVRVIPIDGGGRSAPLNVGIEHALGEYLAILDDDDVVFANWVDMFEQLAVKHPGRVLRSVPAEQDVRLVRWDGVRPGYEIASKPYCRWPVEFDLVEHLVENHSPPCSYVLPRSAMVDLGIRFDDDLPVLEDWDVLLRTVLWCDIADTRQVGALWRRWINGDSSTSVHRAEEWTRARSAVMAKLDSQPLLLPAGSLTTLTDLYDSERRHRTRLDEANDRQAALESRADESQRQLDEIRSSTSWKVSSPVRVLGRYARRLIHR